MPVFSKALHQSNSFSAAFCVSHAHRSVEFIEPMIKQNSIAVAKITFLARGAHFGSDC